jgi:hypothetical protein
MTKPRYDITYNDDDHSYKINGTPVPSVTQILDRCTPKDALPWWGMRVGFAAVIRLLQSGKLSSMGVLSYSADDHLTGVPLEDTKNVIVQGKGARRKLKTPIEGLAIREKLTTNHIRDTKADMGTAVHDAIETLGLTEKLPRLSAYDESLHGYLRGFMKFWMDQSPIFQEQEVIVGSLEHQFAGRFDLIAEIDGNRHLIDFKTSKGVYESHSEQLVLYELASNEMGLEPYDHLTIVHLRPDATYAMYPAFSSVQTAIAQVALFHARAADAESKPPAWIQKDR